MRLYFKNERRAKLFASCLGDYLPAVNFTVGSDGRGYYVEHDSEMAESVNLAYHVWLDAYTCGVHSERNSLD